MSNTRILTMEPVFDSEGNPKTRTTVHTADNKRSRAKQKRAVWRDYKGGGTVRKTKTYSQPDDFVVKKPLYRVSGEDGFSGVVTKKEAKKRFSARQVRKALHRWRMSQ